MRRVDLLVDHAEFDGAVHTAGDPLVLERATEAARCDVFLAIGTSAVVYPAAGLLYEAKRHGAFTVEINPEATDASGVVDLALAEPAEVALDALDQLLETRDE